MYWGLAGMWLKHREGLESDSQPRELQFSCRLIWRLLFLVGAVSPMPAFASQVADKCDELASAPSDHQRVTNSSNPILLMRNPKQALAACRNAVERESENPRYLFQLAFVLELAGDMDGAVEYLVQSVNRNYAAAQFRLGQGIIFGKFTGNKLPDPIQLLRKSAKQGNPFAMKTLANVGVRQRPFWKSKHRIDPDEALSWAQKAVKNGLPDGELHLAVFIVRNFPAHEEIKWANEYLEQEMKSGNLKAYFLLALALWNQKPKIVIADLDGRQANKRAYDLMKHAADNGFPEAKIWMNSLQ